jgi:hypothetical protein
MKTSMSASTPASRPAIGGKRPDPSVAAPIHAVHAAGQHRDLEAKRHLARGEDAQRRQQVLREGSRPPRRELEGHVSAPITGRRGRCHRAQAGGRDDLGESRRGQAAGDGEQIGGHDRRV